MPEISAAQRLIERCWYGARAPWWLLPLSWLFALVVRLRRWAYRAGWFASHPPGVPVVVVGNITVGGTGKTPLVIWLATQLQARGVRVGIVLRGYGGTAVAPTLVTANSSSREVGDEAVLLAQRAACSVCVGRDRVGAARRLVAQGCELIVCDDGLQHLALRRDLEILVIDGARGFGNGALLPAGPLREPVARVRTADGVVVNGEPTTAIAADLAVAMSADQGEPLVLRLQAGELQQLTSGTRMPVSVLQGQRVHAVAGIGNPARFFALLRALGAQVDAHAFADHHRYTPDDLAFADERLIVMTEKDAVKCRAFAADRMYALPVDAQLADADAARLLQRVLACMTTRGRIDA
jgi:tetraacyldisaccharide 4'-kinase